MLEYKNGIEQKKRLAVNCRCASRETDPETYVKSKEQEYHERFDADENVEIVGIYCDPVFSGLKPASGRPGFSRLLEDCKNGLVDCIHTRDPARISRSVVDSIRTLVELHTIGVKVNFDYGGIPEWLLENPGFFACLLEPILRETQSGVGPILEY